MTASQARGHYIALGWRKLIADQKNARGVHDDPPSSDIISTFLVGQSSIGVALHVIVGASMMSLLAINANSGGALGSAPRSVLDPVAASLRSIVLDNTPCCARHQCVHSKTHGELRVNGFLRHIKTHACMVPF